MRTLIQIAFFIFLFLYIPYAVNGDNLNKHPKKVSLHIIPEPVSMVKLKGHFKIDKNIKFVFDTLDNDKKSMIELLLSLLPVRAKYEPIDTFEYKNAIILRIDDTVSNNEGYELKITKKNIEIKAKTNAGLFYAIQTLTQIINFDSKKDKIPAMLINDFPRYEYRGMHLDVCRHFFPPAFVKKYIDLMSLYKFNRFHWHLTEDQGWRIEIKKYPKLTEIGAYRDSTMTGRYRDIPRKFDHTRYGGFYTQEEVKDIVRYAQSKHITIVPEIEMPGHSRAALAAYPELACTEGPFSVMSIWGISEDIYCPYEKTFKFLEDVLSEVIELFPGEYIHIGGDEAPKSRWKESDFCQKLIKKEGLQDEHELQSYFIQRIEKFINSKGKKLIGWDEILEGGLAPNAAVMSWRGERGGIEAARQHHKVVMTPGNYCYFDHYQSLDENEPLAIGGYTPLEEVYSYNPTPKVLNAQEEKYIMGAQGNMWTEYIPTGELIEYMTYPRAIALSEVVWSQPEEKDYKNFVKRLLPHMKKLKKDGVNVANHLGDISAKFTNTGNSVLVHLQTSIDDFTIRYTTTGAKPTIKSKKFKKDFEIKKDTKIKAVAFYNKQKMGYEYNRQIMMHKATGKKMKLIIEPSPKYNKGGEDALINGIIGSDSRYADDQWLGFDGTDFEGVIDLGQKIPVRTIFMRFYNSKGALIYPPKEIEILTSVDNMNFKVVGAFKLKEYNKSNILNVPIKLLRRVYTKYLKIKVKNYGKIPQGKQGTGHKPWLFIDEIIIK